MQPREHGSHGFDAGDRSIAVNFSDNDEAVVMELVQNIMDQMKVGHGSSGRSGIQSCRFHTNSERVGLFGMIKGIEWKERKSQHMRMEMGRNLYKDTEERRRFIVSMASRFFKDRHDELEQRKVRLQKKMIGMESKRFELWKRKAEYEKGMLSRLEQSSRDEEKIRSGILAKKQSEIQRLETLEDPELSRMEEEELIHKESVREHWEKLQVEQKKYESELKKMASHHERKMSDMVFKNTSLKDRIKSLEIELESKVTEFSKERVKALEDNELIVQHIKREERIVYEEQGRNLSALDATHAGKMQEESDEILRDKELMTQRLGDELLAIKYRKEDLSREISEIEDSIRKKREKKSKKTEHLPRDTLSIPSSSQSPSYPYGNDPYYTTGSVERGHRTQNPARGVRNDSYHDVNSKDISQSYHTNSQNIPLHGGHSGNVTSPGYQSNLARSPIRNEITGTSSGHMPRSLSFEHIEQGQDCLSRDDNQRFGVYPSVTGRTRSEYGQDLLPRTDSDNSSLSLD